MLDFHRIRLTDQEAYQTILAHSPNRGCEYAFANLYLWGKQNIFFSGDCAALFSHFHGQSVYPYPIGSGNRRPLVEAIIQDAADRGIPCRFTSLLESDIQDLEQWFPGYFHFMPSRNSFDYVYDINDLADLRGRKFQKKRNHVNRFHAEHSGCTVEPLSPDNLDRAMEMVESWYTLRIAANPHEDYLLEKAAMEKMFRHYEGLGMEGILLEEGGKVLAVTVASRLSEDTFDVHFEKAFETVEGAYAAVNCEMARFLRLRHPEVRFLNREDDIGLEGLRKAKLDYHPHHMVEKYRAFVVEDFYED